MAISHRTRQAIFERDSWTCQICGDLTNPEEPNGANGQTIDHIIPRSLGGSDNEDNLRTTHRRCNSLKGSGLDDKLEPWEQTNKRGNVYLPPELRAAATTHAEGLGLSFSAYVRSLIEADLAP